ncbi:xaa-pro aminopeptidase 3 [Anaeramoeba flamelloides]|uniref:Xaa-pro aminopeptidase 3 n=1 Tax=Anaeramoeba flamelloides TaxID=1746091 RepID=A0ABQ8YTZ8_9EUKA|nr:xaa-pro aminopeptidase 3 [Anaeramoeba flamelloides]
MLSLLRPNSRSFPNMVSSNLLKSCFGKKRSNLKYRLRQYHPKTHPSLMKKNEITPQISKNEYQTRREQLMSKFPNNSLVVIPTDVPEKDAEISSLPTSWNLRPNPNLFYLTGLQEPYSMMTLYKNKKGQVVFSLFVKQRQNGLGIEQFNCGTTRAKTYFGSNNSYSVSKFEDIVLDQLSGIDYLFCDINNSKFLDLIQKKVSIIFDPTSQQFGESSKSRSSNNNTKPNLNLYLLSDNIEEIRAIKSKSEIKLLQRSADITAEAFLSVFRNAKSAKWEFELSSLFEYECKKRGAQHLAFPTCLQSGYNSIVIHYTQNDEMINKNDLILMDAGCQVDGYCSDVTRCYPVSGKFTLPQRKLYEAVLRAQKQLIKECIADDNTSIATLQMTSEILLTEELLKLGIIKAKSLKQALTRKLFRRFYYHNIGHHLGIEVHDVPTIQDTIPLQNGMAITIEPGLYIPYDYDIPAEYRGIGIRIEDDIVINHRKPIILTKNIPKDPLEIEDLILSGKK